MTFSLYVFYPSFRIILPDINIKEAVHWKDEKDVKTLEGILQISPDMLPCDLAVIMHAKCQDVSVAFLLLSCALIVLLKVFVYRTRFFPDSVIDDNTTLDEEQKEPPVYSKPFQEPK